MSKHELPEAEWAYPEYIESSEGTLFVGFFSVKGNGSGPAMHWTPEEPIFYECGCVYVRHHFNWHCPYYTRNPQFCDWIGGVP